MVKVTWRHTSLLYSKIFKLLLNLSLTHLRAQRACYEKVIWAPWCLRKYFMTVLKISKFTRIFMENHSSVTGCLAGEHETQWGKKKNEPHLKLRRLHSNYALFVAELSCARSAQQSTMVRKFGNQCIREILVVTWTYARPPDLPSAPQAYQCKITKSKYRYGNLRLFWREIA